MSGERPPRGWLDAKELGSRVGIELVVLVSTRFGRRIARGVVRVVALYYTLSQPLARRASRAYLKRAGLPTTFASVYRHFASFALVALDRVLFAAGRTQHFSLVDHGQQHAAALQASGKGAILLGAHLGSFEAMRAFARDPAVRVRMVVNADNAQNFQRTVARLDASLAEQVIAVSADSTDAALRIRDSVEQGYLVGILADRVSPGARAVEANFFGAAARFAAGPFLTAAALRCPVYIGVALYRGGSAYELYFEPFAELITIPRADREQALRAEVARFASRLEQLARSAPYNWFNFYDFWAIP